LLYENRRDASRFSDYPAGKVLAPDWKTFEVTKGSGYGGLTTSQHPVGDFALLESAKWNPTMSDHARAVLEPHITTLGEFLPLRYADKTRWLFNCTHLLAAIDLDKSVVSRFDDGRIMHLKGPLYFKADTLKHEWMFLPAERPSTIFVTDKFVKVVEEAKLTGFEFHEIWDSDDPPPKEKPVDPALMHRRDLH
jgi:hypothetical protein